PEENMVRQKCSGIRRSYLVGRVVLFDKNYPAVTSNFVAKMTPKNWVDSLYLKYVFFTLYSRGVNYASIKQTTGIQNLDTRSYLKEFFCIPEKYIQIDIANFLSKKTTQIDEAIAIKEQEINLLRERKQIIIQQAVTQGLDPNVPLKDSRVDWIGKIPEHWEVRRSKFLFTQRKERAWKDDVQLSATQAYGVIPQEQYEELTGKRVVKIQFHLDKRKHVEKDDFVISMRSFQGGLERAWAQGCIRSSYVVLKALEEIDPTFYGYLLKLPSYIAALQQTASFIRDGQDLNFDNFSQVDLFIPPIREQREIANYVSSFMTSSDEGIELLLAQIEKLKEYKTTLINSAVTGKIKITPEMAEQ
ncbi:restriction endonuclease subunit S, partial [Citrobacter portucalensis]|uniref:restriction endonuclease subunit S n=1 Tax=Citrobacter portucalensis TaxID=1639133 RepID=UPI003F76955D